MLYPINIIPPANMLDKMVIIIIFNFFPLNAFLIIIITPIMASSIKIPNMIILSVVSIFCSSNSA